MYTDKNELYKYVEISSKWRKKLSRRFKILFGLLHWHKQHLHDCVFNNIFSLFFRCSVL